jgi:hypothetical protein
MSDWVRVEPDEIDQPDIEKLGHVEITMLMSPYDVPRAVKGGYSSDIKKFVIELRYQTDETVSSIDAEHGSITLWLGRSSGRIHRIVVDVDKLNVSSVELRIGVEKAVSAALDQLKHRPRHLNRARNYDAALSAIMKNEERVFAELPAALHA